MTWPSFDLGFTSPGMSEVFSAGRTVAVILEFEAALAGALFDAGLAPASAAAAIAEACAEPVGDPEEALATVWETGTPLIAIRSEIESRLDDGARKWLHYGATTQDAVDTGHMLQAREGLGLLVDGTTAVARHLRRLVQAHRNQPHMARTFLQDARPTTFGARAAGWLAPTLDHIVDLHRRRDRLAVQLGGPSGDAGSYGPAAGEVIAALSRRLDLEAPPFPWHGDRSPIWSLAGTLGSTARTMAKIAGDVSLLAQSSVGEVRVRSGGSSSMPGKRNPIDAVRAVAAATACNGFAIMLMSAPVTELDRGIGGWHAEWLALPMLFQTAAATVDAMETCLGSLEVDGEMMTAAVDRAGLEPVGDTDPGVIQGVLDRFEEVVGGR
jgi:3-carboxy-cis,cis-muconate cycloisomerase